MTKKIDDKDLGQVTGGAGPIAPAGGSSDPLIVSSARQPAGSGGGSSQPGVVENAAGSTPANGPVDMTSNS